MGEEPVGQRVAVVADVLRHAKAQALQATAELGAAHHDLGQDVLVRQVHDAPEACEGLAVAHRVEEGDVERRRRVGEQQPEGERAQDLAELDLVGHLEHEAHAVREVAHEGHAHRERSVRGGAHRGLQDAVEHDVAAVGRLPLRGDVDGAQQEQRGAPISLDVGHAQAVHVEQHPPLRLEGEGIRPVGDERLDGLLAHRGDQGLEALAQLLALLPRLARRGLVGGELLVVLGGGLLLALQTTGLRRGDLAAERALLALEELDVALGGGPGGGVARLCRELGRVPLGLDPRLEATDLLLDLRPVAAEGGVGVALGGGEDVVDGALALLGELVDAREAAVAQLVRAPEVVVRRLRELVEGGEGGGGGRGREALARDLLGELGAAIYGGRELEVVAQGGEVLPC